MAVVNDNRPEVFVGMDVVHFKELWRLACKDQASQVNVTTRGQAKKTQSKNIVSGDYNLKKTVAEDSGDEGSRVVAEGIELVEIEADISGDVEDEMNMTEIKSDFEAGSGVDEFLESDLEGNESLQVEGKMALPNNLNDVREDSNWPLLHLSKTVTK